MEWPICFTLREGILLDSLPRQYGKGAESKSQATSRTWIFFFDSDSTPVHAGLSRIPAEKMRVVPIGYKPHALKERNRPQNGFK